MVSEISSARGRAVRVQGRRQGVTLVVLLGVIVNVMAYDKRR